MSLTVIAYYLNFESFLLDRSLVPVLCGKTREDFRKAYFKKILFFKD